MQVSSIIVKDWKNLFEKLQLYITLIKEITEYHQQTNFNLIDENTIHPTPSKSMIWSVPHAKTMPSPLFALQLRLQLQLPNSIFVKFWYCSHPT